jgi:hypothetical protein
MKKKIIFYLILFLLVITGIGFLILQYSYSDGQRAGKLVKLSRKGFLPKTYEGTLDLGSGDKLTWDFSIHNNDLGDELSRASGQMVVLEYRELLWPVLYKTKYDVVGWRLQESKNKISNADLCRLVNVLRKSKVMVEQVRPMILKYDADLLGMMRDCQK